MNFTYHQLRILWYIKKNGPLVAKSSGPADSLSTRIGQALDLTNAGVRHHLNVLEKACVILRTYARPEKQIFGGTAGNPGYNAIVRIELVDPNMVLPPAAKPTPLAVVVAHENRDLYERTHPTTEPSADAILEALLNRIAELQSQVDKLQDIVSAQADQLDKARKDQRRTSEHLTSRIRGALSPEAWERLTREEDK